MNGPLVFSKKQILKGLQKKEFFVEYQPMADLNTGEINGFEALVRWKTPWKGVLMPNEFLDAVKKAGLMHMLTLYVIHEVAKVLSEQKFVGLKAHVNISPSDLLSTGVTSQIIQILHSYGVPEKTLVLEMTEEPIYDEKERISIREKMDLLRYAGVKFAMDDCGASASNFERAGQFPFSTLKIDGSVTAAMKKPAVKKWMEKIISESRNSGLHVIVEKVEREDDVVFLRKYAKGMDFSVQGYFLSRSLSSADFSNFIQKGGLVV